MSVKFSSFYLPLYRRRIKTASNFLDAVSIITSASSIAAWNLWSAYPLVWSFLIGCAQILQLIKPLFPFSRRLQALEFVIPDIRKLADDIENDWNRLSSQQDSAFAEPLASYKARYTEIESRYFGSDSVPDVHSLKEIAMADLEKYLSPFAKEVSA